MSIITVVYNEVRIEDTIRSIIKHLTPDVEYIVIDGGSIDGTIEVISKYLDKIDCFVSEPDQGIYDAMNKGIALARGKYIYHLNAGDLLLELPIKELNEDDDNVSALSFCVDLGYGKIFRPTNGWMMRLINGLHHQGTIYKNKSNKYDLSYAIFADFDFNQKMYKNNEKILLIRDRMIARHCENGLSHSKKNRFEYYKVIYSNYGLLCTLLSLIYRSFRGKIVFFKNMLEN